MIINLQKTGQKLFLMYQQLACYSAGAIFKLAAGMYQMLF
jgi:hypothetical protein